MTLKERENEIAVCMRAGLSEDEAVIVTDLASVWNRFIRLVSHGIDQSGDMQEVRAAIHVIQDKIFARPALRAYWAIREGRST